MVRFGTVFTFCTILFAVTVFSWDTEEKSIGESKWYPKNYNHGIQRRAFAQWDDVSENHLIGNHFASDTDTEPRFDRSYVDPRYEVMQYKPWHRRKRSIPVASTSPRVDTESKYHKKGGAKDAKHTKYRKAMLQKSRSVIGKGSMHEYSKSKSLKTTKLKNTLGLETPTTSNPLASTEPTNSDSSIRNTKDRFKITSGTSGSEMKPDSIEVTQKT